MNNRDDYISFEYLKSIKGDLETSIEVNSKWISENENNKNECINVLKENEESHKEISRLDEIILREPIPPELPPQKSLMKISGILDDVNIIKCIGYFQEQEYNSEAFKNHEMNEQVGALLLSIIGNVAGSAVTSQSKVRMKDYCDYISGKINGREFRGWLGKTNLHVGDYVEMAAIEENNELVVYAIAKPENRTISITPRCSQGLDAYIKNTRRYIRIFNAIPFLFMSLGPLFYGGSLKILLFLVLLYALLDPVAYALSSSLERKKPKKNYVLAGLIFEALGFKNPTEVDLIKITKKKLKSKDISVKKNDPAWPDKECAVNYYYYY
ncbi:putative type VI secretion system effector [Hafnia alvei]|uniref:putative type VI secretion system effector n=1 Tax=Hafnia alvei TaxID=569 RepID=UPI004044AFEF